MTPGQFGNSGRNILIGPGFNRVDLGLTKQFGLGGRVRLQVRAEAFNVFNVTSFTGLKPPSASMPRAIRPADSDR